MIKLPAGRLRRGRGSPRNGPSSEHQYLFGEELAGRASATDCGLVADAEYCGEVERVGSG